MKQFTVEDIRSWNPCYDPSEKFNEVFNEQWSGTALDFLKLNHIPAKDRLWAVGRSEIIDDRTLRLFAVWCARQALALVENPDPRSVAACDVAERYANGEATEKEIYAARAAATAAATDATHADAARAAAAWAANAAAYAAATDADAARAAAANAAAWAAAATDTTHADATREQQVEHLIEMLEYEDSSQNRR